MNNKLLTLLIILLVLSGCSPQLSTPTDENIQSGGCGVSSAPEQEPLCNRDKEGFCVEQEEL